jgi:NADPH:quinone reductase-like Zn-dependent oxidoreductase
MKAIQIESFGNPAEVAKAVDIPDVGAPAAGEVVIAVEASPINSYDLMSVRREREGGRENRAWSGGGKKVGGGFLKVAKLSTRTVSDRTKTFSR